MTSLKSLSNSELEFQLKDLVQKERKLLHIILLHVREVDRRKLYLEKAYSSLFEYMTKELHYSGSAAMRRIEAARLLKDMPELAVKIREGTVNLSQIGELSRAIKETEKVQNVKVSSLVKQNLIAKIESKSTQETQKILAQELDLPLKPYEEQKVQKDESVHVSMTLSKDQFHKLSKCKDLVAHLLTQNNMGTSIAEVIEVLMDQFLNDKKFNEPSANNMKSKQSVTHSKKQNLTTAAVAVCGKSKINKTLTPKVRGYILKRDQCCQYVDPHSGRKCESTFALQVDHIQPRWADGDHRIENLRVLCATHNNFKYQKELSLITT